MAGSLTPTKATISVSRKGLVTKVDVQAVSLKGSGSTVTSSDFTPIYRPDVVTNVQIDLLETTTSSMIVEVTAPSNVADSALEYLFEYQLSPAALTW